MHNNAFKLLFAIAILISNGLFAEGDNDDKEKPTSRAEIMAQIETINEQLQEKKAARSDYKKISDNLQQFVSATPLFTKPLVQADIDKFIEDFQKTKDESHLESLEEYYSRGMYDAMENLAMLVEESQKSLELQNLLTGARQIARASYSRVNFNSGISNIKNAFLADNMNNRAKELQTLVNNFRTQIDTKLKTYDEEIKKLNNEKFGLQDQVDQKSNTSETIFKWGFPVFILFILALYIVPLLFFKTRKQTMEQEKGADVELYNAIYSSGLVTEIITVFLLTSTILLLGLTDKIEGQILGTLIGGISGYVLGKTFRRSGDPV